jgi:hypothetical protein
MDRDQLARVIQRRLGLEDQEFSTVRENPKFQRLFENAVKGARYRLVAEVVESKGCHSGHVKGQKLVFDSAANLLTRECPERICAFLMPHITVLINAFFENLMNGRDPNEVMFNRTGCFDVGHACGGWGHVTVEMRAEPRD